jgi:hypothetical protein
MMKTIYGKENAVEALASVCKDYRGTALKAIRQGGEEVYIPASTGQIATCLDLVRNPEKYDLESGQGEEKEPCYASFQEFLAGTNNNGTEHEGCFIVDIIAKRVTGIKHRDGKSAVPKTMDAMLQLENLAVKGIESNCL